MFDEAAVSEKDRHIVLWAALLGNEPGREKTFLLDEQLKQLQHGVIIFNPHFNRRILQELDLFFVTCKGHILIFIQLNYSIHTCSLLFQSDTFCQASNSKFWFPLWSIPRYLKKNCLTGHEILYRCCIQRINCRLFPLPPTLMIFICHLSGEIWPMCEIDY